MTENKVNPDLLINDLLDQIKKLVLDNAVLRTYITQIQNEKAAKPEGGAKK